jgi:hypothetical protein
VGVPQSSPGTVAHSTPVPTRPVALLVCACALAAGCGDDGRVQSDAQRFCGEAAARRDDIVNPPLSTEEELEATLDLYRLMGDLAPLAIAEQWNDLVVNLETASTLVPGDPASEQRVATQAYATERSAYEVAEWLKANCGVDLGPITTIAPQEPVPARTTTVPPTGDDSAG